MVEKAVDLRKTTRAGPERISTGPNSLPPGVSPLGKPNLVSMPLPALRFVKISNNLRTLIISLLENRV